MPAHARDLRDRNAGGVRRKNCLRRDDIFELREDLLLELELLRHGLEDEVRAVERRFELGLEAEAAAVLLDGVQPIEDGRRELARRPRALERLGADVVERRLDPGACQYGAHSRAHRPGPDHRRTSHCCHLPSFLRSWIRRQTRSGESGSSIIGSPASASAHTTAAGTAARAPSPQPLAPYGPGPSSFSTITHVIAPGKSSKVGTR